MDERYIPLSALQHYAFCPRQCALIHNEGIWTDNWYTAQGNILHERVDAGQIETRKKIRYERAVCVCSEELGLVGILDLVEIDIITGGCKPIEYKRGQPKIEDWDRIQLCAQALCLEYMLKSVIQEGALWYWKTRHRQRVIFDDKLRRITLSAIDDVKYLFKNLIIPKANYSAKCKTCSLYDTCNPELSADTSKNYIESLYYEAD